MQTGLTDQKVVVFRVGREEYAVAISAVKEVVPWSQPTPVPEAPAVVEGVVNLRGEIFPVIDLGKLFRTGRLKETKDAKIMIMEVQGRQAGFVVDDVTEVHTMAADSVAPPSPVLHNTLAGSRSGMVSGIVKMGENRLVVLMDAENILAQTRSL